MKLIKALLLLALLYAPLAWSQCAAGIPNNPGCIPPDVYYHTNEYGQQVPVQQGPLYGSFAVSDDFQVGWSVNYDQIQQANNAAYDSCIQRGGKGCHVLEPFYDSCATYAVNQHGQTFLGISSSRSADRDAEEMAIAQCNAQSSDGKCQLLTLAVCSGMPRGESSNRRAIKASWKDIQERSAKVDKRRYWGAVASDGNQINTTYNISSKEDAEQLALQKCDGCKIIKTYEDTCVGSAWPRDKRPMVELATDDDPVDAKRKALSACGGKYGQCDAAVRCSGRKYPKPNPDAG
ncbi:DUF4189 domain-containing protein [Dyella sp.]|uniref:DUF4189 domain-containing protein n=1 Tax=Dyella sp. TaxID=1869338 RepID=UPI002ED15950